MTGLSTTQNDTMISNQQPMHEPQTAPLREYMPVSTIRPYQPAQPNFNELPEPPRPAVHIIDEEEKENSMIQLNLHHPKPSQHPDRFASAQLADEFLHENAEFLPDKRPTNNLRQRYQDLSDSEDPDD